MHLRLIQILGQQSGDTVVLGIQSASGPIPIRTPIEDEPGVPAEGKPEE